MHRTWLSALALLAISASGAAAGEVEIKTNDGKPVVIEVQLGDRAGQSVVPLNVVTTNAPIQDKRLEQLLEELLQSKRRDEQVVEGLYLAALRRLPKEEEKKSLQAELAKAADREAFFKKVLAALKSSKEHAALQPTSPAPALALPIQVERRARLTKEAAKTAKEIDIKLVPADPKGIQRTKTSAPTEARGERPRAQVQLQPAAGTPGWRTEAPVPAGTTESRVLRWRVVAPTRTVAPAPGAPVPAESERDRRLKAIEEQLQKLLKEVHELRGGQAAAPAVPETEREKALLRLNERRLYLENIDATERKQAAAALQGKEREAAALKLGQVREQLEHLLNEQRKKAVEVAGHPGTITLSRAIYAMPKARAEQLIALLKDVKAEVMEVKADGDALIVTTIPETQKTIAQFVGLLSEQPQVRALRRATPPDR